MRGALLSACITQSYALSAQQVWQQVEPAVAAPGLNRVRAFARWIGTG